MTSPGGGQLPPWHLWGTSQTIVIQTDGGGGGSNTFKGTQQLARINYGRPDTWTFFFGGRLLSGPAGNPADINVFLEFDLIFGVGRSQFSTRPASDSQLSFYEMFWGVPAGVSPNNQQPQYVTQVKAPPGSFGDLFIEKFPAQDIQCEARARVSSILPPVAGEWVIEATAYFAPRTHIRPEWAQEPEMDAFDVNANAAKFRGGENKGT